MPDSKSPADAHDAPRDGDRSTAAAAPWPSVNAQGQNAQRNDQVGEGRAGQVAGTEFEESQSVPPKPRAGGTQMDEGRGDAGMSSSQREGPSVPGVTVHESLQQNHLPSDDPLPSDPHPDHPPPAYTELPGQLSSENAELGTNAIVAPDGRVNIRIDQKSHALSQLILPQIQRQLTQVQQDPEPPPPYIPEFLGGAPGQRPPPPLNIVIQVVGSRGDVQPFVALGKVLRETYRHRVRLATHPTFKDFVTENGLEFFSIGGDPAELMAFMVKNPGLMPGFDTLRSGDVGKRRKGIAEILRGTWRSCIETGNGLGVDPLTQTVEEWMGVEQQLPEQLKKPFVADVIVANPPAFGHIHCAEKLGIPLHMMFTMPWSPTQQFPHPLANIQSSNAEATITNYMSYVMVDILTWQGLGDVINRFRKESLYLDPISIVWAPAMLARLKVPFTYCWSPALIPKPKDWSHHISIAGFYFLDLAQNYTPPADLAAFLDAGEPPVYIGFGSIVVDDPNAMTKMIFEAIESTGKRALVSKGWGGLGADELGIPDGVFMLGNCPHDWLFKRVSAVVHHGGAGTTAAGIAAGRPTVVVPFFGDQPFWGAMVARAGAGPDPVPYKDLTAEKLAELINSALKPESLERAQELCNKIKQENGSQKGAQAFHQMLNYDDMRCAVNPNRPAVWRIKRTQVKLSAQTATVLVQQGELNFSDLKLYRPREYVVDDGPLDPISGGAGAIMNTATSMMMGVADMPIQTLKLLNIHPDARSRKGKSKASASEVSSQDATRVGRPSARRSGTENSGITSSNSSSTPTPTHTRTTSLQPLAGTQSSTAPSTATAPASPNTPGTPSHRAEFMSAALIANQGSRSPSRERLRSLTPHAADLAERLGHHRRSSSISAAELRAHTKNFNNSTNTSTSGAPSTFQGSNFQALTSPESLDSMVGTGKGLARILGAGFKSPMDFSLNVAKGFNNVPKLYGADVRPVERVTDLQSGLKVAAKGFGFGLYDGIAGLVTDPYKGAKREGPAGFVKGVGRGIMSVPFRVMGGAWAVPGYAMKGLYQEMIKGRSGNVQNYIVAARVAQGYDEAGEMGAVEAEAVVRVWKALDVKMKRKGGKEKGEEALQGLVGGDKRGKKERWERVSAQFKRPEPTHTQSINASSPFDAHISPTSGPSGGVAISQTPIYTPAPMLQRTAPSSSQSPYTPNPQSPQSLAAQENPHEAADIEEAALIARALRASLADAANSHHAAGDHAPGQAVRGGAEGGDEEEELHRALQASLDLAARGNEEEQRILEDVLRRSLVDVGAHATTAASYSQHRDAGPTRQGKRVRSSDSEWESSTDEDEEDDQVKEALAASLRVARDPGYQEAVGGAHGQESGTLPPSSSNAQTGADEEDEQLERAIRESEALQRTEHEKREKARTEEEIVLEYIKKQSLLEEEAARQKRGGN